MCGDVGAVDGVSVGGDVGAAVGAFVGAAVGADVELLSVLLWELLT